jgi:hypothetical protein
MVIVVYSYIPEHSSVNFYIYLKLFTLCFKSCCQHVMRGGGAGGYSCQKTLGSICQ